MSTSGVFLVLQVCTRLEIVDRHSVGKMTKKYQTYIKYVVHDFIAPIIRVFGKIKTFTNGTLYTNLNLNMLFNCTMFLLRKIAVCLRKIKHILDLLHHSKIMKQFFRNSIVVEN